MIFGPLEFLLGALLVCGVIIWIRHRRFHELALGHVRRFCETNGLQLLDATVAFRGFRFEFRPMHLCRGYRFEYSIDGADRFIGLFVLCAEQTQHFRINPEHLAAQPVL